MKVCPAIPLLAPWSMRMIVRRLISPCIVVATLLALPPPGSAEPFGGDPASGRSIATRLCGSCHRVLPMTLSDRDDPASFQSIADLPSTTALSLNVFLHSNHNNMPNLILSGAESRDVIAYILTLKRK